MRQQAAALPRRRDSGAPLKRGVRRAFDVVSFAAAFSLAILCAACSSTNKYPRLPEPPARAEKREVVVTVYLPDQSPEKPAAGIEVFGVAATGQLVSLGTTSSFGRVWLSKERLREMHPPLVAFCYPDGGPCTAILLGPHQLDLAAFDEFSIDLPPVVFR